MKFFLRHWDKILLSIFIISYIGIFSYFSILRHNAFASGFDLGNADQTVWNTIKGRIFTLTGDQTNISRFSIHADLILILLSPLYLLWNNVRMLLLSQSVFLALGAIPVYLLSQTLLKNKIISLILVLMYLLNPGLQWTNIYDFHGVSMAIPFLLFTFYFAYTKRWGWFAVFAFLAMLTKEEISLSIAWLGVFIFFFLKERKLGVFIFFSGIIWFLLMVFVVIPHFNPSGRHWALLWYQFNENSSESAVQLPLPEIFIKNFTSSDAKEYYISLIKPFALLPIFGLPWSFLALPELFVNLLSVHAQMHSIVFHYDSGITPWLTIGTVFAVYYLKKLFIKISAFQHLLYYLLYVGVFGALVIALRINYHYSPLPTTPSCWRLIYNVTNEDKEFENLLKKIPESASITASPEIRPHVTHREYSFTLPAATSSADFIALIDQNRIVGNYDPKEFELVLRDQLAQSTDYILIKHIGHFYLYKKADYRFTL